MAAPFKLECYIPDGETIKIDKVDYVNDQEDAYQKYVYYTSLKDDFGERIYTSVRLYVSAYKQIQNPTEFFNIFKAQ